MPFQISLPLKKSSERGMEHIEDIVASVLQDFRCLLLTIAGEKINDQDFGVGLQEFLFEYPTEETKQNITNLIQTKTAKYLPFISISDITYTPVDEKLLVSIKFFIGDENDARTIALNFKQETNI